MKEFFSLYEILNIKKQNELDKKSSSLFELDPYDFERFSKTQDANELDLFFSDHLSEKSD